MTTQILVTLATVIAMAQNSNFFFVSEDVLAWIPVIHEVREELELSPAKYSDALILALIHRESRPLGNASSHTPGTRYYGLLQMADAYVADACEHLGIPAKPAEKINGRAKDQLRLFFAYNERYKTFHGLYRPSYIALMHKAGVGSMAKDDRYESGHSAWVLACEHIADEIPGVKEYMNSWAKLHEVYADWIETQNKRIGICSKQYYGAYMSSWHGAGKTRY